MAETWATSSLDLHVDLESTRVRASLEGALRDAIRAGRLTTGRRLPSSRALAADLGIARNTVADAYGQLVAEGWLEARQGSGTRVAERAPAAAAPRDAAARPALPRYDLRAGWPDVASFPRPVWLRAARRALAVAPPASLGYGDPRGDPTLRARLAEYLARVRGVDAEPDRIVVVTGFTEGLALLGRVLRARGAREIAVEEYGHRLHREVIAAAGLGVRELAVDDQGAVTPGGEAALLTPAHQFPLGMALAPRRRRAAIESGALLIEDDYDGEFRYDRQPVGAMQALAPERVVYAGTASKTLAPGLRLAWLVLPGELVEDVAEAKRLTEGQSPSLEQLTLAELLGSGAYDRHVRRMRLVYRRRRDRLLAELARHGVEATGIAAGLHAVAQLGDRDADEVAGRAAERGVAVEPLGSYGPPGPALVVGYGAPPEHAFTAAIARLGAALVDSRR